MSSDVKLIVTAEGAEDVAKLLDALKIAGLDNKQTALLESGINQPPKAEKPRKAQKRLVNGKRTYWTLSMQKRVRKAAADGKTVKQISQEVQIPYQSVRAWLNQNGINFKKQLPGRRPRSS